MLPLHDLPAVEERAINPLYNRDGVASEFGPLRFAIIDPIYFGIDFRAVIGWGASMTSWHQSGPGGKG